MRQGKLKVIYVGGMTRSGSTLIDRLLGELPGVCSIGELMNTWARGMVRGDLCGCGQPFRQCEFWREVLAVAFGEFDKADAQRVEQLRAAVDRTRFIPMLLAPSLNADFRRTLDEYISYCTRLYRAVQMVSGCAAVADSSKNASFAFCLRSSSDLDLRVVHIVRDSRAVAHSWTRRVRWGERTAPSNTWTTRPARAASRWSYQNGAFQLLAAAGMPTLRIRYEDLVAAPKETVNEVARFAGLDTGSDQLDFIGTDERGWWADLGVSHTGSGNPMRFRTGRIRIHDDGEWRAAMPARDRRIVTAITAPLLKHYGYLAQKPSP